VLRQSGRVNNTLIRKRSEVQVLAGPPRGLHIRRILVFTFEPGVESLPRAASTPDEPVHNDVVSRRLTRGLRGRRPASPQVKAKCEYLTHPEVTFHKPPCSHLGDGHQRPDLAGTAGSLDRTAQNTVAARRLTRGQRPGDRLASIRIVRESRSASRSSASRNDWKASRTPRAAAVSFAT